MNIIVFALVMFAIALAAGITIGFCLYILPETQYRHTHTRKEFLDHLKERQNRNAHGKPADHERRSGSFQTGTARPQSRSYGL